MKKIFRRIRTFRQTHRRTRRHAAWQNILLGIIFLTLCAFMLRGYAGANTAEKAVDKWCREMYFGEYEIYAVKSYESGGVPQKQVYVCSEPEDGEYYEGWLQLQRPNPWKWEYSGTSAYSTAPREYDTARSYDKMGDATDMFWELDDFDDWSMMTGGDAAHSTLVSVDLHRRGETAEEDIVSAVGFQVELFSGKLEEAHFLPYPAEADYDEEGLEEVTLWISEKRMVFIAEILAGALKND